MTKFVRKITYFKSMMQLFRIYCVILIVIYDTTRYLK